MDLSDEKPSKNYRNIEWVPSIDDHWKGGKKRNRYGPDSLYTPADSSLTGQPYGDLSRDEIEMMKSGATYRELLFMRLMANQGQPGYITPMKK